MDKRFKIKKMKELSIVLDKKIEIQVNKLVEDEETGIEQKQWTKVCTPWANVLDIGGSEFFCSANENTKLKIKFKIRYRKDIDEDMRVVFNKQTYNIVFIDNYDYKKIWLNLICELVK